MRLVLNTTVLSELCHPRQGSEVKLWLRGLARIRQHEVFLPEIADYELRRKLLHIGSRAGLRALDVLPEREVSYLPITSAVMRDAAALWAALRTAGLPVADDKALGADVILAAQARAVGAAVVTDNMRHIERMVPAVRWQDV